MLQKVFSTRSIADSESANARPETIAVQVPDLSAVRREVEQFRDALGLGMDSGIVDIVVALRVIGINTIGSCYGHPDRLTLGPYVMFDSSDELSARQSNENSARANAKQVQLLLTYLDAFYEGRDVSASCRLIVKSFGPVACYLIAQNADLARVLESRERRAQLEHGRREIRDFCDFLLGQWPIST